MKPRWPDSLSLSSIDFLAGKLSIALVPIPNIFTYNKPDNGKPADNGNYF